MTLPRSVAAFILVLAGVAGCSSTDGRPAAPATTGTVAPTESAEVLVDPGSGTVSGFRLVETLRPQGSGVQALATFGDWVAWSAATGPVPATGAPGPPAPDKVVAYNRRTRRTVVVPRHEPAAIPNLSTGTGDWLIDREILPQQPGRCRVASPTGCFSWRIWAVDLRSGRERVLASSSVPGPQANNPLPAAGDGWVAWQEVDGGGRITTVVDKPEGGARRTVATGVAASQMSIAGGALFFDDGAVTPPRLLRVALPGGRPVEVVRGPKFYRPRASGTALTLVSGVPTEKMSVLLAPVTAPSRYRVVFESNEIYNAWPLGPGSALAFDFLGLHYVQAGAPARRLDIEVLVPTDVAVDGTTAACLVADGAGAASIRLIDLTGS